MPTPPRSWAEAGELHRFVTMPTEEQRRANRKLGWILASVALVFALGFMAKIAFTGR